MSGMFGIRGLLLPLAAGVCCCCCGRVAAWLDSCSILRCSYIFFCSSTCNTKADNGGTTQVRDKSMWSVNKDTQNNNNNNNNN